MIIKIFLLLTLIEGLFVYIKYTQIMDLVGRTQNITDSIFGESSFVKKLIIIVANIIESFRSTMWIPIVVILLVNLFASLILSLLIFIVMLFFLT